MNAVDASEMTIVIGAIEKNKREQIRISVRSFRELRMIDIRIFTNKTGYEYVGTTQGVTIKPQRLREVIEALERAETLARAEGLIQ